MKKVFIKTSRILAVLVIVAIAILVYYSVMATGEDVDMPFFMFLFSFGVLFLFAVTLFIAVVLDIVESNAPLEKMQSILFVSVLSLLTLIGYLFKIEGLLLFYVPKNGFGIGIVPSEIEKSDRIYFECVL